jgi:phosphoenolpyruvate carboxylase
MTEQGEVLTAKYGVPEIAHRELELAASATLTAGSARPPERHALFEQVMQEMAAISERTYRALVHDDPDFVRFFRCRHAGRRDLAATARLAPGAARPPTAASTTCGRSPGCSPGRSRGSSCRPGSGSAPRSPARASARPRAAAGDGRQWPFFATLLSNAEMALREGRPRIAERYTQLWDDAEQRDRIWGTLVAELEPRPGRAAGDPRLTTGCSTPSRCSRRRSTAATRSSTRCRSSRSPYCARLRRAGQEDHDALGRVSLLTINGIASGLRNTG